MAGFMLLRASEHRSMPASRRWPRCMRRQHEAAARGILAVCSCIIMLVAQQYMYAPRGLRAAPRAGWVRCRATPMGATQLFQSTSAGWLSTAAHIDTRLSQWLSLRQPCETLSDLPGHQHLNSLRARCHLPDPPRHAGDASTFPCAFSHCACHPGHGDSQQVCYVWAVCLYCNVRVGR